MIAFAHSARLRQCTSCGQRLPEDIHHFDHRASQPLGLSTRCKSCRRDYQRVWLRNGQVSTAGDKYQAAVDAALVSWLLSDGLRWLDDRAPGRD